ncbi:hypothetical protein [Lachnotalea glycerini]|uniref:Uncharacterized protein n=1 Tax=Lachnotalea glycerini TaxID=1763509 RepID=A0A371JG68_9FIRM|nr:hypothetical protein [Lachnotalea glycerini]RDY31718.1 hypothetical protein CG710_008340 [Lachnotalea glycerini]
MLKKIYERKVVIIIVVQMIIMILVIPQLEYPDASLHYYKIYNNIRNELYFSILSFLNPFVEKFSSSTNVTFNLNPDFGYFLWQPLWVHDEYNLLIVMMYQSVNIILILFNIFLFNYVIKKDKMLLNDEKNWMVRLNLLYYLFPPTSYLIIGITSDIIVYLYQPYLFWMLYSKKYISSILTSVVLFLVADKSAIISLMIIIIYISIIFLKKLYSKNKKFFITFILTSGCLVLTIIIRYNIKEISIDNNLFYIMKMILTKHGNVTTKFIIFFTTFVCLWGSGSYMTFPLFYIIYILLIFKIIYRSFHDKEDNSFYYLILAGGITVLGIIMLFPSYCHIRYFMFFPILFIWGAEKYILKDNHIKNDRKFMLISYLLSGHNIILAILIGIYTFKVL